MDKKLKRELYDLVADDQVDAAIELLQNKLSIDHPSYLRLIKLARRYRELDDQSMDAIIAHEDAKLAKNQIADTLLHIVQTVDRPPIEAETPPPTVPESTSNNDAAQPTPKGPLHKPASGEEGFSGNITYSGSPSMKEQKITLAHDYGTTWSRCINAVSAAEMSLDFNNRAAGRIEASTSGNFITSFGERVLLFVTPVDDRRTSVHIIVDSVLKTMVMDWGRNNNKLNLLVSHLV